MKQSLTSIFVTSLFLATSAFGAASVRMGATGTTLGTNTTVTSARAGSLRTSSTSKPTASISSSPSSVSISKPISNTNARMTFVTPIAGLDIGEAKENTTTKQELNVLGEKLEQLQTQLDAVEVDSADKVNMEAVDRKITEKITEFSTSSGVRDTYSKTEVNNLLIDMKSKIPEVDEKGNVTWTTSNGTSISYPLHYFNLSYTVDLNYSIGAYVINYGTFYMYETNDTDTVIQQYVSSTVCNGETSDWCWIDEINNTYPERKHVSVVRLNHGYGVVGMKYWGFNPLTPLEVRDTTHTIYWTLEDSPMEYVKNAVCGNKPDNECFVASNPDTQAFSGAVANGVTFPTYYTSNRVGTFVEIVERGQYTGNKFESGLGFEGFQLVNQYMVSGASDVTTEEINAYVSEFCNGESNFYCYILNNEISTTPNGTKQFVIVKRLHGHGLLDSHIVHHNGEIWFNKIFYTNEQYPEEYIQNTICQNKPETECYAPEYWDMVSINNAIEPGSGEKWARYQVSLMEAPVTDSSITPVPTSIPLE